MENNEKLALKNSLKEYALALISGRIQAARISIDEAQEAANQEGKSSAGDKYETGRAMGHLQKEMHTRQLGEHTRDLAMLNAIKTNVLCQSAVAGALLECPGVVFFITAGLGKQLIGGRTVLFLSPEAPLAKNLQNKRAGDTFLFSGQQILINDLY